MALEHATGSETAAVEQVVELTNTELLKGRWERRDLERQIRHGDRHLYVAYEVDGEIECTELDSIADAELRKEILGFTLTCVHTYEQMDAELQVPVEDLFDREDFPMGMMKSLVVDPDARGQHVGTELGLTAVSETFVDDPRVDEAVTVVWVRPDHDANLELVEHYGELVAEYDEYYGEGRDCPDCPGDDYCSCTFRIYRAPF
jgi:ribosomal protein S18 acetylase RimI-like enzyme